MAQERYDGKTRNDDLRKWLIIGGGLIVAVIVIALLMSVYGGEEYDLGVFIFSDVVIGDEMTATLESAVGGIIGDINGDGKVKILIGSAVTGDENNMFQGLEAAGAYLSDDRFTLYIMTPAISDNFCSQELFDSLEGYGLEMDSKYDSRVLLKDSELSASLGLEGYYASIIDWSTVGKSDVSVTEAAIEVINGLSGS